MSEVEETTIELDVTRFATHQSPEYDEIVLQSDYATRAALSFYRFRRLSGGRGDLFVTSRNSRGKGIHYVSDHPEVRTLNLSIIALLILFESAANAYFFAQQSEFGLFGGLFQAAAVSLANVATSYFIIGFWGLRHITMPAEPTLYSRRNAIKFFGLVAIILGLIIVLLVNLTAAHYRNILDLSALGQSLPSELTKAAWPRFWISETDCQAILGSPLGETLGSAATNAMCRPFALHSLDAMVLFALGLSISAIATFEGRRADAAYPGFSDAARQFERQRRDVQDALEDYYDSFEDMVERAEETLGKDYKLSRAERIALREAMDAAAAPFRALPLTDLNILRDEFQIPHDVVREISGRVPDPMPQDQPSIEGEPK